LKIKIKSRTLDEILEKLCILILVLIVTIPIMAVYGYWVWLIVYVLVCLFVDWLVKHIEIVEE